MGYIYSVAFFLIGIYLIYNAVKEFKFLFLPGIYFALLGIWWLINQLTPEINLTGGVFEWIIRAVSVVVLVITGLIYYFKYKRNAD